MPQLLSEPWFFIFMSSWFILLIITPQKFLNHKITNPLNQTPLKPQQTNWFWPWP
uniref:ATP synthase complex subunit 8 n=1 Tax=Arthroleptis poecilonotus TaxID=577105 RepID=S4UZU1_ARTPO|nr:ATP synthase F0 subunit 8 [Arthroleptis poecilonotus]